MLAAAYQAFVYLGQTVDIIVRWSGYAEILSKVDNLNILGNGVFLQESLALSMTEAEESHINLVERHFGRKFHIGLAYQTAVNIGNLVACVRLAVGKHNVYERMVKQKADEYSARIAGST
jgi:hypothetical protein